MSLLDKVLLNCLDCQKKMCFVLYCFVLLFNFFSSSFNFSTSVYFLLSYVCTSWGKFFEFCSLLSVRLHYWLSAWLQSGYSPFPPQKESSPWIFDWWTFLEFFLVIFSHLFSNSVDYTTEQVIYLYISYLYILFLYVEVLVHFFLQIIRLSLFSSCFVFFL